MSKFTKIFSGLHFCLRSTVKGIGHCIKSWSAARRKPSARGDSGVANDSFNTKQPFLAFSRAVSVSS